MRRIGSGIDKTIRCDPEQPYRRTKLYNWTTQEMYRIVRIGSQTQFFEQHSVRSADVPAEDRENFIIDLSYCLDRLLLSYRE